MLQSLYNYNLKTLLIAILKMKINRRNNIRFILTKKYCRIESFKVDRRAAVFFFFFKLSNQ